METRISDIICYDFDFPKKPWYVTKRFWTWFKFRHIEKIIKNRWRNKQ